MVTIESSPSELEFAYNGFHVEIVTDIDELKRIEVRRAQYYLDNYPTYVENGYSGTLQWPGGYDPDNPPENVNLENLVVQEIDRNKELYRTFFNNYQEALRIFQTDIIPIAESIFGFSVSGNFKVAATIGSPSEDWDLNLFRLRIPELIPTAIKAEFYTEADRTPIEKLTHEMLAHRQTYELRRGTSILDTDTQHKQCTYPWHKERALDLLGRSILVKANAMPRDEIAIQVRGEETAGHVVDQIYYLNPGNPSEDALRYGGDVEGLFKSICGTLDQLQS